MWSRLEGTGTCEIHQGPHIDGSCYEWKLQAHARIKFPLYSKGVYKSKAVVNFHLSRTSAQVLELHLHCNLKLCLHL